MVAVLITMMMYAGGVGLLVRGQSSGMNLVYPHVHVHVPKYVRIPLLHERISSSYSWHLHLTRQQHL